MRLLDPAKLPHPDFHRVLLGGVAPRPIAFVSTLDKDGRSNLAPFSFFNAFGINPPVIAFSPAYAGRTGLPKDTLLNILETKECTVSIISYDMVHQASLTSAPYERGVDEFVKSGFTKLESKVVKAPGVRESPFVMEAKLIQHLEFGGKPGSANMLICEVVMLHVRDSVFDAESGAIDPYKMDQVARLGGPWYTRAKKGLFKWPQPTSLLPGYDSLPEELRLSHILTGSDLAKLATVEVPVFTPCSTNAERDTRHAEAKKWLESDHIAEAWSAITGTDQK